MVMLWLWFMAKVGLLLLKLILPVLLEALPTVTVIIPQTEVLLLWQTVTLEVPELRPVKYKEPDCKDTAAAEGLVLLEM